MRKAIFFTVECLECGTLGAPSGPWSTAKSNGAGINRICAQRDADYRADEHNDRVHNSGSRILPRAKAVRWEASR